MNPPPPVYYEIFGILYSFSFMHIEQDVEQMREEERLVVGGEKELQRKRLATTQVHGGVQRRKEHHFFSLSVSLSVCLSLLCLSTLQLLYCPWSDNCSLNLTLCCFVQDDKVVQPFKLSAWLRRTFGPIRLRTERISTPGELTIIYHIPSFSLYTFVIFEYIL